MKKRIFALVIGLAAAMQLTAYGDTYDSISVSGTPTVGDTFTVTIKVTNDSDDDLGYLQASLEYDDAVIEFVGGDAIGGGGLISVHTFPDAQPDTIECALTFKAVGEGDSTLTLSNGYVFSAEGVVLSEPSSSGSVHVDGEPVTEELPDDSSEVEEPDDSSEVEIVTEAPDVTEPDIDTDEPEEPMPVVQGYLTSLKCDVGELEPEFAYNIFEYTVHVDYDTLTAELTGTAAAFSDIVTYSDAGELKVGDNIRTVRVVAEDGSENIYTVNIIRDAAKGKASSVGSKAERDKLKDTLNPALAIVLVTLVVALAIVIIWIRGNVSGKNKGKKKKR